MVTKKKLEYGELQVWHCCILLFIMPFVIVFGMLSGNSYCAVSIDTLNNALFRTASQTVGSNNMNNFPAVESNSTLNSLLNDYDGIIVSTNTSSRYFINFTNSLYLNSGTVYSSSDFITIAVNFGYSTATGFNGNYYFENQSQVVQQRGFSYSNYLSFSLPIYDRNFQTIYYNPNIEVVEPSPTNTITLTSTSLSKFSYNDFNQCVLTTTGDWSYGDFVYSVERLINNEWVEYVPPHENYVIFGYENPWYLTWNDINYWQVGTYRYVADYNSLGEDLYYSEPFNITGNVVENIGTIDNGNLTIDTGQTVDDIKDFMGGPADFDNINISKQDIEDNLNMQEVVNPYDNFIMLFINGLTNALTNTSTNPWTFKVHSWGQTFSFYPQDVIPPYSQGLKDFLTIISTSTVVFYIIKWVTQIVEAINVGDVSKSLELIEEKYSDLL